MGVRTVPGAHVIEIKRVPFVGFDVCHPPDHRPAARAVHIAIRKQVIVLAVSGGQDAVFVFDRLDRLPFLARHDSEVGKYATDSP